MTGTVRRRRFEDSDTDGGGEDDVSTTSSGSDDEDEDDYDYDEFGDPCTQGVGAASPPIPDDEALVESALRRIGRARAKGKADVKLDKRELAALERRRRRMLEEEARRERGSGSGGDHRKKKKKKKKKKKQQRIAVPLSHLEPVSHKKRTTSQHRPHGHDSPPRHVSTGDGADGHQRRGYPPMGCFAPPSTSHSRQRSGTSSARASSRTHDARDSSPLHYEYITAPSSANRHASDSATWSRSSRHSPRHEAFSPSGVRSRLNPFQYQTEGPRMPYTTDNAASPSRRHVSGPAHLAHNARREAAASTAASGWHEVRLQSCSDGTSDDGSRTSEEETSDNDASGARVSEPPARGGGARVVVDVSPEPERVSKKKATGSVKRKPVPGSRRKKR